MTMTEDEHQNVMQNLESSCLKYTVNHVYGIKPVQIIMPNCD